MEDYKKDKRFTELVRLYGLDHAEAAWKRRIKLAEQERVSNLARQAKKERKLLKKAEIREMSQTFIQDSSNKIKKLKPVDKKTKRSKKKQKLKIKPNPYNKNSKYIPLDVLAARLEQNLPKSEQWFRSLYETQCLKHELDEYNSVFCRKYIGDIVNRKYKYIIEIDGSIHLTPEQITKDKKKDALCRAMGYKVFRIAHNNPVDYINVIKLVLKIRGEQSGLFDAFCSRYGIKN